ncbi:MULTISPECIES: DUF4124 domain-containing protein [unclassified Duganella]|uniref:DUF4124 domain-containing protein n=1 Tax=unclassified Duganella TaxID=2636909 RepID=UPI0006F83346|nr:MULTISPECIES: DUF4124 domain-containing protein [unclassified Duganella]KQV59670.1 hypothetical protein ASD07_22845 [Duganella sp. Root336D2]KRB87152.1 hypothetical protein ASE26_07045 [Duganella sp. Root198D2]
MKIILPLILAFAVIPAHAQLFKWTDADGKVHYSDRPQDGVKSKEIAVQRAAAKPAKASSDDWQQRELDSRERRLKRENANQEAADTAARSDGKTPYNPSQHRNNKPMTDDEVCKRDAQQIEFSEKVPKLAFGGSSGSVAVSEEERQAIVRQRKENHALLCGSGQRTH